MSIQRLPAHPGAGPVRCRQPGQQRVLRAGPDREDGRREQHAAQG